MEEEILKLKKTIKSNAKFIIYRNNVNCIATFI